ncbi:SLC13 family permease [Pseudoteredinibacter isoporae]|uniref:SLC13 family permease n=1 Tax=Pseudoteredinibacter isoporae TaxID=570281 RepID=UPI003341968F
MKGLSLFVFIAILWLTEAIPLSITALLVPLCATLTEILPLREALASFATPIIFLFLAGFAMAASLKKQGIDMYLADKVIQLARGNLLPAILLLFGLTAVMSMWMSNTATIAVMMPLALGLIAQSSPKPCAKLYLFALLGLAYSASVGGIATLVGSPPNAIIALEMGLDFYGWLQYGLPISAVLLPCVLIALWLMIRPDLNHKFDYEPTSFTFTREGVLTIAIFLITVLLWVSSKSISAALGGIKNFDVLVALLSITLLGISRVIDWKDIEEQADWGVLLLFGGGLCLSAILKTTGVSDFIANAISSGLIGVSMWLVIASIALFVVFLTELSSNTASAAVLVPIFVPVAEALGVPAMAMAITIGVAASCAFMLPVATPPNAIVFSSGKVPLNEMMKKGLVLNMMCVVLLLLLVQMVW